VLLDSPPLLPVVDAALLARACDATLLVALAGSTRKNLLRRAKEQLAQSGASVIGGVLNRVPTAQGRGYRYYSSYKPSADHKRRRIRLPFLRKVSDEQQPVVDQEGLAAIVDVAANEHGLYPLEAVANGNGHHRELNGARLSPKVRPDSKS
jgi:hypothetical protein